MNELKGRKVAILLANGFEQQEMTDPKSALEQAGAEVFLVSPESNQVKGWKHTQWGDEFAVDIALDQAKAEQYDALMLPGGVMNPDKLRITPAAVEFVKHFVSTKKPIAAICHAPWILIDANATKGQKLTSYPSIKIDLINAGAEWTDAEVVRSGQLVTSRKPADLPAFNKVMISLFAEGVQS
ncbi:type 1 glutamine amidotransferase domain-containing protein [soil metagenome]